MKKTIGSEYTVRKGYVQEATNLSFTPQRELVPLNLNANAVLVHLFPHIDEDGNQSFQRVVTISCVDPAMKEPLMLEASRILRE